MNRFPLTSNTLAFCVWTLGALLLFSLSACQEQAGWLPDAEKRFEYQLFSQATSEQPTVQVGDSVWVDYILWKDEKPLKSSYQEGSPYSLLLPPPYAQSFLDWPLQLMHEGDSLRMRIPAQTVWSELGKFQAHFESHEQITFTFKLQRIHSRAARNQIKAQSYAQKKGFATVEAMEQEIAQVKTRLNDVHQTLQTFKEKYTTPPFDTLAKELYVKQLQKGTGANIDSLDEVWVYYHAIHAQDTAAYDSAFKTGNRIQVKPGSNQLLRGLEQAVLQLQEGARACVYIPAHLGYGASGSLKVPADADLFFYIEIPKIRKAK